MIYTTAKQDYHTKALSDKAFALTATDYKDPPTIMRGGYQPINEAAKKNKILCLLWKTYGKKKVFKWGIAVLDALQQPEVLRQRMHEKSISIKTKNRNIMDDGSLPCPKLVAKWLLRDMRKQQECGCSSQRWKSAEQFVIESAKSVSELPYKDPSSCKEVFNMWEKGEGIWLLQQTLYQIQEIWRSFNGEWKGGDGMKDVSTAVRRLTPL